MDNLHQATTFNEVLNIEEGGPQKTNDLTQIDSSTKNLNKSGSGQNKYNVGFDDDEEEGEGMPVSINDMIKKTEEMAISQD